MNSLLKNFEKFGDLYALLELKVNCSKKEIKKAYKQKALIYHPDKNKASNAVQKFQEIKDAYEILSDDILKENYDKFLRNKQYHINRKFEQDTERNKFANDLLQKEKEYNKQKEEEAEEKLKKFFARKEDLDKKQLFKKEKEKEKEELDQLTKNINHIDESEYSKKLNSIKIKWKLSKNSHYNKEILNLIFSEYGGIKDLLVIPDKKVAIIEYFAVASADKAYEDYNEKNEKSMKDDGLKVKYLMKRKKRKELLSSLSQRRATKIDLTINTSTLEKIGSILNRDSKTMMGSHMEELRKRQERTKMMSEIIEKEMFSSKTLKK